MNDVVTYQAGEECGATAQTNDPLGEAARKLCGVPYLFPHQRLVISNILEAASAAGIAVHWPGESEWHEREYREGGVAPAVEKSEENEKSDRECCGRQLVIMPTGSGKSLCFQLPAMLTSGATLVIYPILGLMADQERRLREYGCPFVTIKGGQTKEEREAARRKITGSKRIVIIANPEVLLTSDVMPTLERLNINHVVIDEAHCASEWGESFRPAYLRIADIIKETKAHLVTAFTATAGETVVKKIERFVFAGTEVLRVMANPDRKNISYRTMGSILPNLAVRDLLFRAAGNECLPAIVFCSSRIGTETLARYLRIEAAVHGLSWRKDIRFYHAGLSREEKKEIGEWFLQSRRAVLTATCAYGLGIDKADIRTVIHRDCPPSVEAYLQESGRAGRDGAASASVLLFGPHDERLISRAETNAARERLLPLLMFARNTKTCRRDALLSLLGYQGELDYPSAHCCDVCEKKASSALREEQSLVDFFRRNRYSYTAGQAVHLLAASSSADSAPAWSPAWSMEEAAVAVNYLIKSGKVKVSKNPLWKGKLRPAGARPHSGRCLFPSALGSILGVRF